MQASDPESLRSRALRLLQQAEALIAKSPLTARPSAADAVPADEPAQLDQAIDESVAIEAALDSAATDDVLLARVRTVLGGLYATRHVKGYGTDKDGAEGIRLLRAARNAGHINAHDDPDLTLLLATTLLTRLSPVGTPGSGTDLRSLIEIGRNATSAGAQADDLREVRALLHEIRSARPGDPLVAPLAMIVDALSLLFVTDDGDGDMFAQVDEAVGRVSGLVPGPVADQMNVLMQVGRFLAALPEVAPSRDAEQEPDTGPALDDAFIDSLTVILETAAPGSIHADELERKIDGLERAGATGDARSAAIATLARFVSAMRTGVPADLDRAVQAFQALAAGPAASGDSSFLARSVFPATLAAAAMTSGNRQDAELACAQLDVLWSSLLPEGRATPAQTPALAGLYTGRIMLRAHLATARAWETENDQALDQVVSDLTEAEQAGGTPDEWRCMLRYQRAVTKLSAAWLRDDADKLAEAVEDLRAALDGPVPLPFVRPLFEATWPAVLALSSVLERRPARLAELVRRTRASLAQRPVTHDQHTYTRLGLAMALRTQYDLLDGVEKSALLDDVIDELERARATLTEHSGTGVAARILWESAQARRLRGASQSDGDGPVGLALESLRLVADDVLLQSGAEHALQSARAAAGHGLRAAFWALDEKRERDAVECLERGRALVLRTAAASRGVPDLLREAGEPQLAQQWERSTSGASPEPSNLPDQIMHRLIAADDLRIPSELRRRALGVLRADRAFADPPAEQAAPELSNVPDIAGLTDCVRSAGLDALVYIVPSDDDTAGRALMICGNGAVRTIGLPGLSAAGRGPFDAYVMSAARRSARLREGSAARDFETGRAWTGALDELCAWAGSTVELIVRNLPVLPTQGSPGRVVLVPCGTLGVVPWAAASLPCRPADGSGRRPVRACDLLVISYAASGRELLRSVGRDRARYDADPVLVIDPTGTLAFVGSEAAAIRRAHLTGARVLGVAEGLPSEGRGTPQEVLAALAGDADGHPASMVQISAHGTASTRPTASRLVLADPDADPAAPGRADGGARGYLTVERILAAPPFAGPTGAGPLIVLDCCDTDLSNRDHDEALTLTSVFVAQGAADAVGSRWSIDDWSTAVCMVVFHHYLDVARLAPADALRAAQRWMLGPEREDIPALTDGLLPERAQDRLAAVSAWGAFVHQGNPRPAPSPR